MSKKDSGKYCCVCIAIIVAAFLFVAATAYSVIFYNQTELGVIIACSAVCAVALICFTVIFCNILSKCCKCNKKTDDFWKKVYAKTFGISLSDEENNINGK